MASTIPTNYGRVLRRTDRDVRLSANMRYASYDVNLRAIAVEHPDGVQALTLFFPSGKDAAAQRATRLGWVDVTDAWRRKPASPDPDPVSVQEASVPKVEAPSKQTLAKMAWSALRGLAKERGVAAKGSRESVEAAVLASYQG